jgi:DNA-binding transcriptional LysR family regulator
MNTQQLESFLAVAENLSFARAAEDLNITQSAVSRQIHALEEELETRLFHRTSRSVALTPAGISFYEDAKNFLGGLRVAAAKIKRHSTSNVQILSLGFGNDIDCELSAGLLQECRKHVPELHPFLRIIPHRSILNLFLQDEIDIMFGFHDDAPSRPGVIYEELFRAPVCCILPVEHAFADRETVEEQELYAENIVICNSYSLPARAAVLQNRMERHFPVGSVYYCDNLNAMLALVKAGYGFGILPEMKRNDPGICAVPFAGVEDTFFGFSYKENSPNPMVKKFVALAKRERERKMCLSRKKP